MIRIGVIGLGMMGRTHIGVYDKHPDAQLVAIADIDPKRAAGDLSSAWSNIETDGSNQLPMDRIKGTTDYRDLLAMDDVDVVDVCVPTPDHAEIAIAALEAGKHVVCEKPLARIVKDAEAIAKAARSAKGYFMPAMCIRFWGQYAWLKKAVEDGRYGLVKSAMFRRLGTLPPGWFRKGEMSGGAMLDLHVHDVDFVYYLLGKPRSVYSSGYAGGTGAIDHVMTQYAYDDVPLVVTEGCWTVSDGWGFNMSYLVNFENATADFDFGRDKKLLVATDGKRQEIRGEDVAGYDAELNYFLDCVKNKRSPTVVTADDAVEGLRIVDAETKSIATGKIVKL